MKMMTTLATAMLFCSAAIAAAGEPPLPIEKKPALMLYLHKSFGEASRKERQPLALGLRLQRDLPIAERGQAELRIGQPVALLDLRYSLSGRSTLSGGGALMWDSSESSAASSGEGSLKNPWMVAAGAAAIIAILCATKVGICKSSSGREYNPEAPPGT